MDQINNLTDNQIKVLEIEALEEEIKALQDKVNILRATIDFKPKRNKNKVWISNILDSVCQYTDFNPNDIMGKSRTKELVKARSLFVNLCLDLTRHSSNVIGHHLNNRDHTSILYHKKIKQHKDKYWNDDHSEGKELWKDYNNIRSKLILETEQ